MGDLQAHDYTDGVESPLMETMVALQSRMLESMFNYFDADQIFVTPGNNDGVHNSLFVNSNDVDETSLAWADYLIENDIVNNDLKRKYTIEGTTVQEWSQTQVFEEMGYYIKHLPEHLDELSNTFALVLNTNLGSSHYLQNAVFEADLQWIYETMNGKAIVLAHHPNVVTSMISEQFLDAEFILGIFSGHVHYFAETDENGFTILPALSQYAYVNAIATTDVDTKTGKLTVDSSQLLVYDSVEGETANYACWSPFAQ